MVILDLLRGWWHAFTLYGGGKGGGAPPPPDYRGAAIEQAAASKDIATQTTWANRPQLNTPWGQQTWSAAAGTDPSTGQAITNWTSDINLTPESQDALNAQQRITAGRSAGAETLLPQAVSGFQKEFDWAGVPDRGMVARQMPTTDAARALEITGSQNRAYGIMSQMLEPARSQAREALNARLLASGVDPNSEQAKRASAQQAEQFAAQDKQMMAQALQEGRADATTQFGMSKEEAQQRAQFDQQRFAQETARFGQQNTQRQQAIAEEAQRRGMTLNELNALLTGQQVTSPQMPSFSAATQAQAPQFLEAAKAQGDYGIKSAELSQGGGADVGGLLGSIGGMAMSGMGGAGAAGGGAALLSGAALF